MVRVWYLEDEENHQNEQNSLKFLDAKILFELTGVLYYNINLESDKDKLEKLKAEHNIKTEDMLIYHPDALNVDEILAKFTVEHLHADEEMRYFSKGRGFFDVRNAKDDKWIRIEVAPGDLVILPAGIYHRFTIDENKIIEIHRYFSSEPQWKAYNRPAEDLECRKHYVKKMAKCN